MGSSAKMHKVRLKRVWIVLFVTACIWMAISYFTYATLYLESHALAPLRLHKHKGKTLAELDTMFNVVPIYEDVLASMRFEDLQWVKMMKLSKELFSAFVHKKEFKDMWEDVYNRVMMLV